MAKEGESGSAEKGRDPRVTAAFLVAGAMSFIVLGGVVVLVFVLPEGSRDWLRSSRAGLALSGLQFLVFGVVVVASVLLVRRSR